ncbi:hypothetical protein DFH29DRAFT_1069371 [Suillus ampliporus]|nr:hypothetical protein DFH29DRAFT_1069371 [Suillus ampliporus]
MDKDDADCRPLIKCTAETLDDEVLEELYVTSQTELQLCIKYAVKRMLAELTPSEAEGVITQVIHAQLDNAPLRLFDTTAGLLCDREARINIFKTSTEYKELLSFAMENPNMRMFRIEKVTMSYFGCVMLSHRTRSLYELNAVGGILKLQTFCKIARDAGYHWAWSDTCCIDKNNNIEFQESLNSMFLWYRHSALTIVYLSDVPPSSKSGALAESEWIRRGWTVGEFLAPKVIRFFQKDWTPYLDDNSPNHKQSVAIMQELGRATGILPNALVAFHPGMKDTRVKLQWASTRVTTRQEDIAYSLFGIFNIHCLSALYGEKKHNALGRLLQEIVAQSGDITALDWVGKSSEFNSCLPDDITAYKAPPSMATSLPGDEMQTSVSLLRNTVGVELASEFYTLLDKLSPPRFANRRLHLPCIVFRVTVVRRRRDRDLEGTYFKYEVKADGLHDLLITTQDKPSQFSRAMDTRQTLLLVHPWSRNFLEPPAVTDDIESVSDSSMAASLLYDFPLESRSPGIAIYSPPWSASQVFFRQPFSAFMLAQQPGGEYKRIMSDFNITAQVRDTASVRSMMDVRILEIL